MLPVLPPPVLEKVFVNVPHKEVVCVCRLVCREWKEVADSAALWRERCRRDRFRPHDITRPPTDWRLFYFLCKNRRNLLKNPSADEEFNGWQILENWRDEWRIEPLSEPPDGTATKYFATSYEPCKKYQLIDLVKEGYSQSFMDEIQPDIVISDWYAPRWDCGSMYEICVELLSRNKKVIRKFCPEPVVYEQWNDQKWQQMTHVFRDYGQGVRFVRFCHGGKDTQFWKGWFGIRVTKSSVEICPSAPV
ncbi:F-box only protein 6-like [Anguilla rostrata]|uniref:F-box only protein 6-like n=1 Tax=Anguilla rostrata TaxID=7938 RepID=UPI0030D0747E